MARVSAIVFNMRAVFLAFFNKNKPFLHNGDIWIRYG